MIILYNKLLLCPHMQVLHSVDDILFSIIFLHGLSDSKGHIWRCRFSHYYAIELTIPSEKVSFVIYCLTHC